MFENSQTYNSSSDNASLNKGIFVLRSPEAIDTTNNRPQRFIAAVLMAAFMGVLSLQAGFVMNASALDNPISSPITGQQSAAPSTTSSTAPITAPENSAAPSASPEPSSTTTPNQTTNTGGNPSSNGGGSSSNGGGSPSAPSCNNEVPKSAPKIVSAVTTGKNEITLNWEKAQDPVTHYVISYGLTKNKPLYGNPNVGNVSSYTVKGLSGGFTYYFRVRAANDCMPGMYSEEIGVKVGGKFINSPAQGFKPGVLGKATVSGSLMPQASGKPALAKPVVFETNNSQPNIGLIGKIANFFKGFFN